MPFLVLGILFWLPLVSAANESCHIDHRKSPKFPNNLAYDQDRLPWCTGWTSSLLASFETKQAISATGMSILPGVNYGKIDMESPSPSSPKNIQVTISKDPSIKSGKEIQNIRNLESQLKAGLEFGFCTENQLNSAPGSEASRSLEEFFSSYKIAGSVNEGGEVYRSLARIKNINELKPTTRRKIRERVDRIRSDQCSTYDGLRKLAPELQLADIIDAATMSPTPLVSVYKKACTKPVRLKNYHVQSAINDKGKIYELIETNVQKRPVAIELDNSSMLRGLPKGSHHAIAIVGKIRSPTTGRCMYVLKNSWGPSCNQADLKNPEDPIEDQPPIAFECDPKDKTSILVDTWYFNESRTSLATKAYALKPN